MTRRQAASALAVLSAMAMVVLDAGLLNIGLPTIAAALDVAPARSILAVSAYQMTLVVGLLPSAHLAERIGHRRLFVAGLALFCLASVLCALAPSLSLLVAARVLQGVGGAAILSLGVALLRFALGPDRLAAAIGWNASTVALCSAAAPILGAATLSVAAWPWLFLAKLPIGMVALVAAGALPADLPSRKPIDLPAMLLHAAVASSVLFAAEAMVARPFAAVLLAAAAIVGGALLIGRERARTAPLWPIDLLRLRSIRVSATASICSFTGQSAALLALPFHMQLALGYGPGSTGAVMACWPLTVAATAPLAGRLAPMMGTPALCAAGGSILGAGLLLAALWPTQDGIAPLAAGAMLSGIGFGLFQVPNNRILFQSAAPERSAAAGGLQGSARLIGQSLGAIFIGLLFSGVPTAPTRLGLAIGSAFAIVAALVSALEIPASFRRDRA